MSDQVNLPTASPATVKRLQASLGSLSTATLKELERQLPWYKQLRPKDRSVLGMIAQKGISSFVTWYEKPTGSRWVLSDIFGTAPTELARSISLQRALQLIRVVVGTVEQRVPELASRDEATHLREAVLRFSREVAFAAADVYARAAESRGAWDSRLEALIIDSILRSDTSESTLSRIAAIGWTSNAPVTVLVASSAEANNPSVVTELRRTILRHGEDCLVGLHAERITLFVAGFSEPELAFARLQNLLGDIPIIYTPEFASLLDSSAAVHAAFAALNAVEALPGLQGPVNAEELLPERAMLGDAEAKRTLINQVYLPLKASGHSLVETLSVYVSSGHSLEGTARQLHIHSNTVRYRLKRIAEITGWDPLNPREAFVLHTALVAGRLAKKIVGSLQTGELGLSSQ